MKCVKFEGFIGWDFNSWRIYGYFGDLSLWILELKEIDQFWDCMLLIFISKNV